MNEGHWMVEVYFVEVLGIANFKIQIKVIKY